MDKKFFFDLFFEEIFQLESGFLLKIAGRKNKKKKPFFKLFVLLFFLICRLQDGYRNSHFTSSSLIIFIPK